MSGSQQSLGEGSGYLMAKKVMIPKTRSIQYRERGIGTISLVLGICGLCLFSWTIPLLGAMFGLMAWIIGYFAEKQNQRFATVGIYTGIIAVFLSLAIWIWAILLTLQ